MSRLRAPFTAALLAALAGTATAGPRVPVQRLVLGPRDASGFTAHTPPSRYTRDTLETHLGDRARQYLGHGVEELVTYAGNVAPGVLDVNIEIYDMASVLGAFGILSCQRRPQSPQVEIGTLGFAAGKAICFIKDRYYVRVEATGRIPKKPDKLLAVARALAGRITEESPLPRLVQAFPSEGRVPRTEAFRPGVVLGQDYLRRAYVASYKVRGVSFELYLIEGENAHDATDRLIRYREAIRWRGRLNASSPKVGEDAFAGRDGYYGPVLFARSGPFIIGAVGRADGRAAALLRQMASWLEQDAKGL